jgi:hypothetical protein
LFALDYREQPHLVTQGVFHRLYSLWALGLCLLFPTFVSQPGFDLSPNLSPTRREALKLAPFPSREGGWGLGLTVPRSAENRYISNHVYLLKSC